MSSPPSRRTPRTSPELPAVVAGRDTVAVVAHPDDESFGLGALLAALVQHGSRVRVLCLTHGEASTLGGSLDLRDVRARELTEAAAVLGVEAVTLLDHADGHLGEVPADVLDETVAQHVGDADLVVVFEPGGVTGHSDHVAATASATRVATRLQLPRLEWGVAPAVAATLNEELGTTFVGLEGVDLVVDRRVQRAAIACHLSQSRDNPVLRRRLELQGDRERVRVVSPARGEGDAWAAKAGLSPLPPKLDRACNGRMTSRIVILGGGTGGTLTANRLRRRFGPDELSITVVDQDDRHVYQPGLLFVPFGLTHVEDIVRPRARQLHHGIEFVQSAIDRVDIEARQVHLEGGSPLDYDVLVVASGATLVPEETEGLTGAGWMDTVFTFYTPEGAAALEAALTTFDGGRVVVNVVDMPIKCPVAPLEFCFLADWYFHERGIRDRVQLTYVTPLDGAFTKPVASQQLGGMLADRGIELVTEFNTGEVDGGGGRLVSYDEREVGFDLAVVVPLHGGAAFVGRSPGLGDDLNFVPTDEHTLQAKAAPNIFVIGDAANVPASKAGSVTHFEGETVVENIARFLQGEPLVAGFDGHANCFIETGYHKALLIDFNYDHEPVPGHYPTAVGLPLLKESRLNHLGKLLFESVYWHGLLPGREIPGIGAAMPTSGRHQPAPAREE